MKEECCREKMLQSAWGPTERFLRDGDSDRHDHGTRPATVCPHVQLARRRHVQTSGLSHLVIDCIAYRASGDLGERPRRVAVVQRRA